MKKLIAVLIALAMVLSMSVMAFAAWQVDGKEISSPSDITTSADDWDRAVNLSAADLLNSKFSYYINMRMTIVEQGIYEDEDNNLMGWSDAWKAYYAVVIGGFTENPKDAATEIIDSVSNGYVEIGDAVTNVGEAVMGGLGGDGEGGDLSGIVDDILGKLPGIGGGDEGEVSSEAYAEELKAMINDGAEIGDITSKIGDDIASGKIVLKQLPEIAEILAGEIDAGNIEDNETVQQVLDFIKGLGGEGGIQFPDFGDIELPWDNGNSEGGSFLDTILGILGSIGDLIFGGGDGGEDNNGNGDNSNDDPWGEDNTEIPDTGDVSFVAVAAVAAVAGVALVLTRKKENDAE